VTLGLFHARAGRIRGMDEPPDFCGVWRTGSAAIRCNPDGTFECLHYPATGTYRVIRDMDFERGLVLSKTGYILVTKLDAPPGIIQGVHVHFIDELSGDQATLRMRQLNEQSNVKVITRDSPP
jgi:hypothetical protein